jgi:energy-coupling factor transporter ATP-binding protein EcfA2
VSLLELENVRRSVRRGAHEQVVLRDVSLRLEAGELVAVWGARHSGRSMLLRVAAGIEPADSGVVRFDGRALSAGSGEMLGEGIAYCRNAASSAEADGVLDELVLSQLARGVPRRLARTRALAALERAGAERCGAHAVHELDGADTARVRIAGALVAAPVLLLIEEPTSGVELLERDAILGLLRSLADEGLAVLMSAGQATALSGADRALSLTNGVLRGSVAPELAPVLPLRARAQN